MDALEGLAPGLQLLSTAKCRQCHTPLQKRYKKLFRPFVEVLNVNGTSKPRLAKLRAVSINSVEDRTLSIKFLLAKSSGRLDLGWLGLTSIPDEVFDLTDLEVSIRLPPPSAFLVLCQILSKSLNPLQNPSKPRLCSSGTLDFSRRMHFDSFADGSCPLGCRIS